MTETLTQDDFLGGRLRILQPASGYRAGVDPVLLAAATPARAGESVLELGCGTGVASLCLAARVAGLEVTGVELQTDYADLARRNAAENAITCDIITADLRSLPAGLRQRQFDHVIMNPPYHDRAAGTAAANAARDIALGGDTPLADWIDIGARRLAPRGYLTMIQRMDRLPEVLAALKGRLGAVRLCPVMGRPGKAPTLFLLQARQEGRAAFRMMAPLIMHEGQAHDGDRESYTRKITDVLRNGAELFIWR